VQVRLVLGVDGFGEGVFFMFLCHAAKIPPASPAEGYDRWAAITS
jgi:hypothetical protein